MNIVIFLILILGMIIFHRKIRLLLPYWRGILEGIFSIYFAFLYVRFLSRFGIVDQFETAAGIDDPMMTVILLIICTGIFLTIIKRLEDSIFPRNNKTKE